MTKPTQLVFDGHNDLLLRLHTGGITREAVKNGAPDGHIDLPRARRGGLGGGFFAMFVPGPAMSADLKALRLNDTFDVPLPAPLDWQEGARVTSAQFAALLGLEADGVVKICRTVDELRAVFGSDRLAAIAHIEGAEAIGPDLDLLHVYHAAGLRSIGPVWSRPTIFGHGVPFRFPATPDTGAGLTEDGKRLVRECNALGIMIDLSHMNEKGFDDVARISDAPLVATHSNVHALCECPRNLTDRQLDAIADSDGMVGLNFATGFLRPDGKMNPDTGVDVMIRHLDHLIERLGEDRVGLGSDFDGATIPDAIGDCAGLPVLTGAMRAHGYDDALMAKLCHENWFSLLGRSWKG